MKLVIQKESITQISLASVIFFLTLGSLFKPGEEIGLYTWLIRPSYVVNFSNIIFIISITVSLLLLINFFLVVVSRKALLKPVINFNFVYLFVFSLIYFFSLINSNNPISEISRIITLFCISAIMIIYFSMLRCNRGIIYDYSFLLYPILLSGSIFVLVNMFLFFFDRDAVISDFGRMYGTTEHPNFLGVNSAIVLNVSFYYLFSLSAQSVVNEKYYKSAYFVLFAFLVFVSAFFLVVLSGSRTALLLSGTGLLITIGNPLRLRMPYLVSLVLIVASLVVGVFLNLTDISGVEDARSISTENTRSYAWSQMLEIISENPFSGVGISNVGFSENTYLRVFASSGMIAGFLYIFIVYFIVATAYKIKQKVNIGSSIFAVLISLSVCAIFEGFLMDSFSYPVIVFCILSNLSIYINFLSE